MLYDNLGAVSADERASKMIMIERNHLEIRVMHVIMLSEMQEMTGITTRVPTTT